MPRHGKPTPIRGQGENSVPDQETPQFQFRGIWVSPRLMEAILNREINGTDFLIYCMIDAFTYPGGRGCFATNEYLGKNAGGLNPTNTSRSISKLISHGFVVSRGKGKWRTLTVVRGDSVHFLPCSPGARIPCSPGARITKDKKRREEKTANAVFSVAGRTGDGVGDDPAVGGRSSTVSRDRAESPQATTPVSCGLRPPRRGGSRPGQSQNNTTPVAVAVVPDQPNNHREGVSGASPPRPKKRSSAPALKHDSDKSNDSESETVPKFDKVSDPTEEPSVDALIPPTVPQTPTRGRTVEPRHYDLVTQLRNAVVTITKYGKRYTRSSWAKEFAILESTLEGDYSRLTAALDWFCVNIQWEFAPQIRSARKFRERFADVESAMARHARNATKRPTIAQDAQTPEVRGIVRELSSRVWRNGSEEQLPAVVHQSLMNLRSFFKRLRENPPPGCERVVRTLEDGVGNSAHYITGWVRHQGDRLHRWDKWDGSLGRCVWHPGHEDFLRDARTWVGKTGARSDLEKLEMILRPSAMGW